MRRLRGNPGIANAYRGYSVVRFGSGEGAMRRLRENPGTYRLPGLQRCAMVARRRRNAPSEAGGANAYRARRCDLVAEKAQCAASGENPRYRYRLPGLQRCAIW
jgi:hypothetical protein